MNRSARVALLLVRVMKTSRTITLSAFLTLGLSATQAMAADGWGASWSFGPVHPTTSNHIIYAKTTLVPGRLPVSYWSSSSIGPLFLWPGMSNPTSDLVQTTMDAWSGSENSSYCGAATGQWCVEASVFGSFGQRNGPSVAIDPDDHVTIEYKLGSDNNTWTQTVTSEKLGKVVSTLTSTSGLMYGGGFGFATEADADSFTVNTAYYLCTEIHLAAADSAFGATGVGGVGANHGATGTGSGIGTAKNLHTPDSGLTWLVNLITLPAMNPQGTQTAAPAYNCTGTGGTSGTGGAPSTGGMAATGGARTGGAPSTGGTRAATGGAPSTGGSRATTGGSPGSGGIVATGGKSSTGGNVNVATGGLNGVGGNPTTGGRPSTGGTPSTGGLVGNGGTGGLVGNGGTGGVMANTGGKSGTSVGTMSATGGANTMAGSGNSQAGSAPTNGGESALAGNSSTLPSSSGDAGTCSCSVPGKTAPRGLLALAIGGAALALRRRRSR